MTMTSLPVSSAWAMISLSGVPRLIAVSYSIPFVGVGGVDCACVDDVQHLYHRPSVVGQPEGVGKGLLNRVASVSRY